MRTALCVACGGRGLGCLTAEELGCQRISPDSAALRPAAKPEVTPGQRRLHHREAQPKKIHRAAVSASKLTRHPASLRTGSILVRKAGQAARLAGRISRDILKQQCNCLSLGVVMASQSSLGQIASASSACTGDVRASLCIQTYHRSSQSKEGFDHS